MSNSENTLNGARSQDNITADPMDVTCTLCGQTISPDTPLARAEHMAGQHPERFITDRKILDLASRAAEVAKNLGEQFGRRIFRTEKIK